MLIPRILHIALPMLPGVFFLSRHLSMEIGACERVERPYPRAPRTDMRDNESATMASWDVQLDRLGVGCQ